MGGEINYLIDSCSVSVEIRSNLSSLRRYCSSIRVDKCQLTVAAVNFEIRIELRIFFSENVVIRF